MPSCVIGVTGSVATGKSTFARILADRMSAKLISTDEIARRLLGDSREVKSELREAFGDNILDESGQVKRSALRTVVFDDPGSRSKLEAILHPRIRREWTQAAKVSRETHSRLIVEIPLLFEKETQFALDRTVCVSSTRGEQMRRLSANRHLDEETSRKMIASQWPLDQKERSADHVVWNQGPLDSLTHQANLLAEFFFSLDD